MKTAEDFLRQYAKGKPLELFIRDGGGELANNSRHIADVMEAYKEHCAKAENLPISDVVGQSKDLYALLAAGWIHTTERMPKNVTPVLVLGWCCDICHNIKIAEMEDDWFESGTGEDLHFKPDFWQPLPFPACVKI